MKHRVIPCIARDQEGALTTRSADGVFAVTLQITPEGVFVERVIQRPGKGRAVQAAVFRDPASFRRWCDADNARFDYPLVSQDLIRHADELFSSIASADIAG